MKVDFVRITNLPTLFFGWPANHGHWQWGDELLFGAAVGMRDTTIKSMHKVSGILQKLLFRSSDGGESWTSTLPNVDFEGADPRHVYQSLGEGEAEPDNSILRFCGFYDHGGEACDPRGAFYYSNDKGYTWAGPFLIEDVDLTHGGKRICTTRTCQLGDLVFLSHAHKGVFGSDRVVVAQRGKYTPFFEISELPDYGDGGRQVMPAAAVLDDEIIVLCRRRLNKLSWISAYVSDNHGVSWRTRTEIVAVTGDHNGNPPALLSHQGRLIAAYGNRSTGNMMIAVSDYTKGQTWRTHVIKLVGCRDFGYPQLFARSDGAVVCVYYVEGVLEAAIIRDL
jgi:hypothetical protein